MNIGGAVEMLRAGRRVARAGWNGKGMWLMYVPGGTMDHPALPEEMTTLPYIAMRTGDGYLVPWLASQTDVLAEDWEIVFYLTTNPANRGKPDMIYAEKPEIAA